MATRVNIKDAIKRKNKKMQMQFAKELADAAFEEWNKMVDEMNPRFQEPYRKAMKLYRQGNSFVIELDYEEAGKDADFVRGIEYGYGGGGIGTSGNYDMRDTMLKSLSVKISPKDGSRYLDVPLKMSASTVAKFGGEDAVTAARKLAYYRSASERKASAKRYRFGNPSGHAEIIRPDEKVFNLSGNVVKVPGHTTDPLANLYRMAKQGTAQPEFSTFRRISSGGKPWVGAPIKQHRLIRKLRTRFPKLIKQVSEGG